MVDLQNKKESFKDGLVFNIYGFIILAFLIGYFAGFFLENAVAFPITLFGLLTGIIAFGTVKERINYCIDIASQKKIETKTSQEVQNLDLKSLVAESLGWEKTPIQCLQLDEELHNETLDNRIAKLKKNVKKFKDSQEALNGLLFSKKRESSEDLLLEAIAIHALENTGIYKSEENFREKYQHLYAYLRGWLICSIRYNTNNLPINLIQSNALTKQEQINAIFYIRNYLIEHKIVQEYIPNKDSREIISEYLKKLESQIKKSI